MNALWKKGPALLAPIDEEPGALLTMPNRACHFHPDRGGGPWADADQPPLPRLSTACRSPIVPRPYPEPTRLWRQRL